MLIPIRILIYGSGDSFVEREDVFRLLDDLAEDYASRVPSAIASVHLTVIHQGRNALTDRFSEDWAVERGMSVWELPVLHRGGMGQRNQHLLDQGRPDAVLAFPGGRSALDLVVRARRKGIKVVLVPSGGTVRREARMKERGG